MKRSAKYAALDVHQATTVVSVREQSGRVIARSILPTDEAALVEFFGSMRGSIQVAFEEGTQAQCGFMICSCRWSIVWWSAIGEAKAAAGIRETKRTRISSRTSCASGGSARRTTEGVPGERRSGSSHARIAIWLTIRLV
jgi:hypothetical protein